MPREGHIAELRQLVGTRPLFLPGVAVMVRDAERLLVGRHRDLDTWVVPGGALEPGERLADAAVREVWEETGLVVELEGIHGVYGGGPENRITYPNDDVVDYVTTVFVARAVGGTLAAATDELVEIRWVTMDELDSLALPAWMAPMLANPGFVAPTWAPQGLTRRPLDGDG